MIYYILHHGAVFHQLVVVLTLRNISIINSIIDSVLVDMTGKIPLIKLFSVPIHLVLSNVHCIVSPAKIKCILFHFGIILKRIVLTHYFSSYKKVLS